MHLTTLLPLALATLSTAQSTMSLAEVLAANNKTLSTLNGLLATQPTLLTALSTLNGITILAPSNAAFSKILSTPTGAALSQSPDLLTALLQYHVLNGSVPSSAFTTTPQFLPTLLTNASYANVTGGQVVMGVLSGKSVQVFSGLKEKSTVTTADVMFSGGIVHVIDTVLTVPLSPSGSAVDSQLTALAGALTQTNLVSTVDGLKDVTIFAPSNKAFQDIGSATSSLSTEQLSSILEYHVIAGTVGYSSLLMSGLANESLPTVLGSQTVNILAEDKKVFVNSAEVVITDIIVANGVMHVIDNVLNPSNTTASPVPTATLQAVAFAGASSVSNVPFTSGISVTTTAPSASTATAGAVGGMPSMAVGMAALFGGVAGLVGGL